MTIYFNENVMEGACGISVLYDFSEHAPFYGTKFNSKNLPIMQGGAGLITAGFVVGDPKSDEMFATLSKRYNVVFVSTPRLNRNSNNMFYMAVFESDETEKYGYDDADDN